MEGGPNGTRPRSWPGLGLACQGELILLRRDRHRRSLSSTIQSAAVSASRQGVSESNRNWVNPYGERSPRGSRYGDPSSGDPWFDAARLALPCQGSSCHSGVASQAQPGGFGCSQGVLVGPFDCRSRWAACGSSAPVNNRHGMTGLARRRKPAREGMLEAGPGRPSLWYQWRLSVSVLY